MATPYSNAYLNISVTVALLHSLLGLSEVATQRRYGTGCAVNKRDAFRTVSTSGVPVSALLETRDHVEGAAPQHRVVDLQASDSEDSTGHCDKNGVGMSGRAGTWNMGPVYSTCDMYRVSKSTATMTNCVNLNKDGKDSDGH
jgi:hypothetical protein